MKSGLSSFSKIMRRKEEIMAKNDNAHAIRFLESMGKHGKGEEAAQFSQNYPLSKSASAEKKYEWAQKQCEFLNEQFDDQTVKTIRMDCACGPELGKAKKLKDMYEKEQSLAAFTQKANALNQGFALEYDGEYLYQIYPQCYCSCVKRFDTTLPKAWCYCTLGYTKRFFEYILDREVEVELLSSVKQGDSSCKIRIK